MFPKSIDVQDLARDMTLHIEVERARVFVLRWWLATQIFRFGAWVAGVGIKVGDQVRPPTEETSK